jgi:hypothetical protein
MINFTLPDASSSLAKQVCGSKFYFPINTYPIS